jgi:hypothetical protein
VGVELNLRIALWIHIVEWQLAFAILEMNPLGLDSNTYVNAEGERAHCGIKLAMLCEYWCENY